MMRARNLFLNLFLVATLFTLIAMTSCKNILGTQKEEPLPENPATENSLSEDSVGRSYARLILGVGVAESSAKTSRTILPDAIGYEKFTYILHCETSDASVLVKTFHKEWESYEKMKADADIVLELGLWELTLSAKNGDVIVFSEKVSKTLVEGENSIVFDLKSGTGDVDVTLSYPANSGIAKIQAAILDISSKSPISGFGFSDVPKDDASKTARYSKTDIPAGNYLLKFQFMNENDEEIFIGFVEAIQIRSDLVSRANLTISKLATTASKYGDYGFATKLKANSGASVFDVIETVPKNMPASAFYWRVESDTITDLSMDENGCLTTDDAISDYPATAKVIATPKSGGESIECMVLLEDDLVLNKTKLQKVCELKGIDYTTMTEFEIPHGYKALADGEWDSATSTYTGAFCGCTNLEKVTLPETLEEIGDYSFQGCSSLKTVKGAGLKNGKPLKSGELPQSLTSIGKGAFYECISLERITIPGSVESIGELSDSTISYYPTGSFSGCIGLQEIIIEEGVKTIGYEAFYGYYYVSGGSLYNTSITKISISRSVQTIDAEAFMYMKYKTTDISDATEVKLEFKECKNPDNTAELTIQGYAFKYCDGFRTVTLPNNLKNLGTELEYVYQKVSSFEYCKNLKEVIFEKDSICEKISYCAFSGCEALETISLPRTKSGIETKIGYGAFQNLKKVTSLTIPGNVTEIGQNAFSSLTNLSTLTIEEGVRKIGQSAFAYGCDPMMTVEFPSTIEELGQYAIYNMGYKGSSSNPITCVLKAKTPPKLTGGNPFPDWFYVRVLVPEESLETYFENTEWKAYRDNFGAIGKNTFLYVAQYDINDSNPTCWYDDNGNGVKDDGEKTYRYVLLEPGAPIIQPDLMPTSPGKTFSYWWVRGDIGYFTDLENPSTPGNFFYIYANYVTTSP